MANGNSGSRGPLILTPSVLRHPNRVTATIIDDDIVVSLPHKHPLNEQNVVNLASVFEDLATKMISMVRT